MDSCVHKNSLVVNKIVNYLLPATRTSQTDTRINSPVAITGISVRDTRNHSIVSRFEEGITNTELTTSSIEERLSNSTSSLSASATSLMTVCTLAPTMVLTTPRKEFQILNTVMLQMIREKLHARSEVCELHAVEIPSRPVINDQLVNLIKNRYLVSAEPTYISATAVSKTPVSYRHLIDLTSFNLKCVDVFSGEQFLCKIVNEPFDKVQRAYFQLQQDEELRRSTIYGHALIRKVHDIVSLSNKSTYIIIASVNNEDCLMHEEVMDNRHGYENLHTYIRQEKRLCEAEARPIFHQICQTVQVCHRNGIILRDLKLKRFYFIDEARTKLQYESLEGAMILNGEDDILYDKIGCPLYTAPELLCPLPTYHGKPADMWSLGVILYTMLVGQYPFYEKANCNLITTIRNGSVEIPTSLSKSVRWLLMSLLQKNYKERMTVMNIFLTPWLREQRPLNVQFLNNWDKDEEVCKDNHLGNGLELRSTSKHNIYENQLLEPLDYTRSALQLVQRSNLTEDIYMS